MKTLTVIIVCYFLFIFIYLFIIYSIFFFPIQFQMTFYSYNYSEVEKCVRVVHGMYDNTEVVVIDVLKVGVGLHQETSHPF